MSIASPSEEWQERALCRDMEPSVFFPHPNNRKAIAAAKAICRKCPVRVQCGRAARAHGETDGVWGGRWFGKPGLRA